MPSFSQSRTPLFLFLSIGVGTVGLHCGGAGASELFADVDSGGPSKEGGRAVSNGANGGGNPQGGSDGGTQGAGDAATARLPDGGAPPGAGQVVCGSNAACVLSTSTCCVLADGGAACVQGAGASCGGGGGGLDPVKRLCDEAADCPSGAVCCLEIINNSQIGSSCHADCGGNGGRLAQACRQQAECQDGTCQVRTCAVGGPIESCGPLSNLCP